jgi:Protein of unknown function (DUF1638)
MSNHSHTSKCAPSVPRITLLACLVFEREIALYARGAQHIAEVRFFEMGLHDRPDQAPRRFAGKPRHSGRTGRYRGSGAGLWFVRSGHGGTASLAPQARHPARHDCITVFMGSKETYAEHQRRCPTCYYYMPGWNRGRRVPGPEKLEAMRAELAARFEPDDVVFLVETEREQWALHDTAAYLELGTDAAAVEADYARKCADWLGWKFEQWNWRGPL